MQHWIISIYDYKLDQYVYRYLLFKSIRLIFYMRIRFLSRKLICESCMVRLSLHNIMKWSSIPVYSCVQYLTRISEDKMAACSRTTFQEHFLEWKWKSQNCWSSSVSHICWSQWLHIHVWALARNVKLGVAHAPGMPGTFSPPPRVNDPDMHHGTCARHAPWCIPGSLSSGFRWSRWRGKRFRRVHNLQFNVPGKRSMVLFLVQEQVQDWKKYFLAYARIRSPCVQFSRANYYASKVVFITKCGCENDDIPTYLDKWPLDLYWQGMCLQDKSKPV